jgi:hypothetical protein
MRLARAARTEEQDVGSLLEPGVPARQSEHVGLAQARHGGELEGGERLARRQVGLGEVTRDAPGVPVLDLVLA